MMRPCSAVKKHRRKKVTLDINATEIVAHKADAGADQTVAEGASVTLNGSGSSDPESANLTYTWEQTSGTPTVTLTGQNTATPTFTAPRELLANAVLVFSLTVNDGVNDSTTPATQPISLGIVMSSISSTPSAPGAVPLCGHR